MKVVLRLWLSLVPSLLVQRVKSLRDEFMRVLKHSGVLVYGVYVDLEHLIGWNLYGANLHSGEEALALGDRYRWRNP